MSASIGLKTRLYLHPCDHKNPAFMDVANTKVVGAVFRFLQSSGFHQISLHVCPFMTNVTEGICFLEFVAERIGKKI